MAEVVQHSPLTHLNKVEKFQHGTSKPEDADVLPGHIVYDGLQMVTTTHEYMDNLYSNFQFKPSDIVIATFPRSGTLITSEIVWHIKNKNIITRGGHYGEMSKRVPFLEMDAYGVNTAMDVFDNHGKMDQQYRIMKTHLPQTKIWPLIERCSPSLPKVIVTLRNPKDVAASMYHFYHNFPEFQSWPYNNWNLFIERYMRGKTMYNDIFEADKQWWKLRHHPNILIVRYESLIREPHQQLRQIVNFLDETLTPEQEDIILNNVQFKTMHINPDVNFVFPVTGGQLMRKGTIGDWKNYFTVNQNECMDQLIYQRLGDTGLCFEYE